MIDRKKFFDGVRKSLFGGKLLQRQVYGMEQILREWEKRELTDLRWLAYILGTVYHEVDKTMEPIEEYGRGKNRVYGHKVKYSGKPYSSPDKVYYGRGLTQNTWYEVYEKLTKAAKAQGYTWDFLNNPELLLTMDASVWATFEAMTKGWYTGKKLSDYFNDKTEDWYNARRIINRLDKAQLIEDYSKEFLTALK